MFFADEPDESMNEWGDEWETMEKQMISRSETARIGKSQTEIDIARLVANAPPGSVRQTINVEREEEEIIGPLPNQPKEGPDGLLNFDTISEKVDLGIQEGVANLVVKVRCERIVPIRGVEDMFKKSSVIVTRRIEIDLNATNERRNLYNNIMDNKGNQNGRHIRNLSNKETFKLYKAFMGLADAEEGANTQKVDIAQRVEDQERRHVPDLHLDNEHQLLTDDMMFGVQVERKPPDFDQMSYSAASEISEMLF